MIRLQHATSYNLQDGSLLHYRSMKPSEVLGPNSHCSSLIQGSSVYWLHLRHVTSTTK